MIQLAEFPAYFFLQLHWFQIGKTAMSLSFFSQAIWMISALEKFSTAFDLG